MNILPLNCDKTVFKGSPNIKYMTRLTEKSKPNASGPFNCKPNWISKQRKAYPSDGQGLFVQRVVGPSRVENSALMV